MYSRLYACIPELAVLPLLPDNQGLKELSPPGMVMPICDFPIDVISEVKV